MNLSNIDIYSDDSKVAESMVMLDNIIATATECTTKLNDLYNNISNTNLWIENGKEQCITYLALIKFFSSMVSAGADSGLNSHLETLKKALSELHVSSEEFEQGGSNQTVSDLIRVVNNN